MSTNRNRVSGSRRGFLKKTAAATAAIAGGAESLLAAGLVRRRRGALPTQPTPPAIQAELLTEHLAVYRGPINTGILRDGKSLLVIDCGDGSFQLPTAWKNDGLTVGRMVFTHHHRDQACGAQAFVEKGAFVGVPSDEVQWFEHVERFWNDPKYRWHLYYQRPHMMLAKSLAANFVYCDDDEFAFGPAKIRVISTPGHTDGSVSYLVEVDGKRVVFCGDTIYDKGRIWELYSLQKAIGKYSDYHGFLGARKQLVEGLGRIKAARPDVLVPSHGHVTTEPAAAIDALVAGLQTCYDKYGSISSLRHYFPELFRQYMGKNSMPFGEQMPPPDCLRHFGTTWLLVSKSGAAFCMDCGYTGAITELKKLLAAGKIRAVEGLWITHYHDDHMDAVPAFQQAFACPCITDQAVAAVISEPLAWRLPCISPSKCRVDRPTRDGESWQWHEFKLTAYRFPGQTLYHSGLLVEGEGLRMFFVGDSFAPGGLDDYCAQNRNFLGAGVGLDYCMKLLDKLQPTHLFNPHVDKAFRFSHEQYAAMRANLAEREKLFGELFPWDNVNYGMDESWVRSYPYEQRGKPGEKVSIAVVVTNHSQHANQAQCRAVSPWQTGPKAAEEGWVAANIAAKSEGRVPLVVEIPADARPGRYVVTIDVRYADKTLPQFAEAIVTV
jgi:glyoxylase-like metal-dependent hydrolase (beta-lactamase superfamily II)